jgi:hypothetical protein
VKNKNIGPGIILILLGIFWMLENLGFITWSLWDGINDLWPLIFVVIGLNLLFKKNTFLPMITWILFFLVVIGYGFFQGQRIEQLETVNGGNVRIANESGANRGRLDLDLGGGSIYIGNTKEFLVDASIPNPYVKNKVNRQDGGKRVDVQFEEQSNKFIKLGKNMNYQFNLNDEIVWDLDIDMGATSGTIDLSQLNVRDIDLDAGAADVKLIFGDKIETVNVKIDTGASSIDLSIPEAVGTKVKLDGALKSSNLKNLGWKYEQGVYQSSNYDSAQKKINVDLDMGAGSLDVNIQ